MSTSARYYQSPAGDPHSYADYQPRSDPELDLGDPAANAPEAVTSNFTGQDGTARNEAGEHKPPASGSNEREVFPGKEGPVPKRKVSRRPWLVPAVIGAVIAAILTGGAVGGGVVASFQSKCQSTSNEADSTDTPQSACTTADTATTTGGQFVNYLPAAPSTVYNVSADCDSLSNQKQTSVLNESFTVRCAFDIGNNRTSETKGPDGGSLVISDLLAINAYTLDDCIGACSEQSKYAKRWGRDSSQLCRAVTFSTLMAQKLKQSGANCWLKNGTTSSTTSHSVCPSCISAEKNAS